MLQCLTWPKLQTFCYLVWYFTNSKAVISNNNSCINELTMPFSITTSGMTGLKENARNERNLHSCWKFWQKQGKCCKIKFQHVRFGIAGILLVFLGVIETSCLILSDKVTLWVPLVVGNQNNLSFLNNKQYYLKH